MSLKSIFPVLAWAALAYAQSQQPPNRQRDVKTEDVVLNTLKPTMPRSYAVIIGISRYPKLPDGMQLFFPERDAQSIRMALTGTEGLNFKAENVHTLIGGDATLASIRHEIDDWLPSVAKEGDRVLIYYAGHGLINQGKGYLAPVEFDLKNVAATGYPMDELGAVMGGKIHATYKILLTDACHSGAISPEDTQSLNSRLLNFKQSLFSLTASRDREKSLESPDLQGGHGVFTYFVVKGLEGEADTDHDGLVTADELQDYVYRQVRDWTGQQQNPTSERGSYDPGMLLSYVPRTAIVVSQPASQVGTLVFEANMDGVEVFVDEKSVGVISGNQKNIQVFGLQPGPHLVKGVRMGYEPDGPREEIVYPGLTSPVTLKIVFARRRGKVARDLFDKGFEYYKKGNPSNYKSAAEYFSKALQAEPTYSEAAYYLAVTYNALLNEKRAEQYFKKAIDIDPDYLAAHVGYAGMLLDIPNLDEALRQIGIVLDHRHDYALAWTMQAQAQRLKGLYPESIKSARQAIQLAPTNAEPHLWLGDSLRALDKCVEAKAEYSQYLKLSDFDSKLAGQLNYWVVGSLFGLGKRKHASQHDIWQDLHSLAWFGMCNCDMGNTAQLNAAIRYCQNALRFDPRDPYAHYALGVAFANRLNQSGNAGDAYSAEYYLQRGLELNSDLKEADDAKKNLAGIRDYLAKR